VIVSIQREFKVAGRREDEVIRRDGELGFS